MGYITKFSDAGLHVRQGGYTVTFDADTLSADRTITVPDGDVTIGHAQAALITSTQVASQISDLGTSVIIPVSTSAAAVTINLPSITAVKRRYTIADFAGNSATNAITISPASGDGVGNKTVDTDDTISGNYNTITMESVHNGGTNPRWVYL